MKKLVTIFITAVFIATAFAASAADYKIAWYAPMYIPILMLSKRGGSL